MNKLIEALNLEPDPYFEKALKLAKNFEDKKEYTMQQIFNILEKKYYRPSQGYKAFWHHCNRIVAMLEHYELLKYHSGFYTIYHKQPMPDAKTT